MSKTTETVTMDEAQPSKQPKPNPFSFFNLQLPFLPPKQKPKVEDQVTIPNHHHHDQHQQQEGTKPNLVRFPKTQVVVPSTLQVEVENEQNKTSNNFVLWQVYALGAFFVSRWIWERWNERRGGGGRSPNNGGAEGGRHNDDGPRSPSLDNE